VLPNAENVFGFFNVLVHILGLQIFLAPTYASPMLTLYFIGLIIVFYTIYPILIIFSKNSKRLLLNSLVIFLGFLLISKTLNIIDHRFFMFFPIFIFGILICRESLFEKSARTLIKIPFIQILLAALPILFVLIIVLGSRTALLLDPRVSLTIDSAGSSTIRSSTVVSMLNSAVNTLDMDYTSLKFMIDSLLLNVFIVMFCIFEYRFAMKFINDKFSSSLNSIVTSIATASYCVYLFHRPFFTLWNAGTNFITSPVLRDTVVVFVAIPLLFFISYHIQIFELNLKRFFSHEKVSNIDFSFTESTFTEPSFAESTITESATGSGK
jgi:peptidoglycan/LPS O-acetylase OafA/YrhL